jgi:hypothetical protein
MKSLVDGGFEVFRGAAYFGGMVSGHLAIVVKHKNWPHLGKNLHLPLHFLMHAYIVSFVNLVYGLA